MNREQVIDHLKSEAHDCATKATKYYADFNRHGWWELIIGITLIGCGLPSLFVVPLVGAVLLFFGGYSIHESLDSFKKAIEARDEYMGLRQFILQRKTEVEENYEHD